MAVILVLFVYLLIGTVAKKPELGGNIKCKSGLLQAMVLVKVVFYLRHYLLRMLEIYVMKLVTQSLDATLENLLSICLPTLMTCMMC